MGPIVLLLVVVVAVAAAPAVAELPRLEHSPKADGSLSILAVGDWGRRGEFNQSRVATQVRTDRSTWQHATPIWLAFSIGHTICHTKISILIQRQMEG